MPKQKPLSCDFLATLLESLRRSVVPQQGIQQALDKILETSGSKGTYFQTAEGTYTATNAPHDVPPALVESVERRLATHADTATGTNFTFTFRQDREHILVLCQQLRHGPRSILLLWRATSWSVQEKDTLSLFWQAAAALLELEALYHEALQRTRHDPGTGLFTWNGMKEEINRRLHRLDTNGLASTLILVQVNGIQNIAKKRGPLMEAQALEHCVTTLRNAIRPTDPIGRIGLNLFALWLDGGDRFAAAERAESITQNGVHLPPPDKTTLGLQAGLACREAGSHETTDSLLEQATLALRSIRPGKSKAWLFAQHA